MFKTGIPRIFLAQKKISQSRGHPHSLSGWRHTILSSVGWQSAQVPTKLGHYLSSCHNLQDPSKTNLDPPVRSFRNPFLPVKSSKMKFSSILWCESSPHFLRLSKELMVSSKSMARVQSPGAPPQISHFDEVPSSKLTLL